MPGLAQVSGRIDRMEVRNFKSYKGDQVIGPFRNFTAIIGPNGAGKSNLMDAISFVLGVRSVHLRGDKLRDLVYSLGDADPDKANRRAHVMLAYVDSRGEELRLLRGITVAGASEYRINGSLVTWEEYNDRLKSIGILVKARNFLVFQGDVENMASKNPKELTALFEHISHSDELRKDYERLEEEKKRAEEKAAFSFQRKKNTTAEKKQRKEQKEEAEKHLKLCDELKEVKRQLYLWQLYANEQDTEEGKEALERASEELREVEKELEELQGRGTRHSKERERLNKEMLAEEKKAAKKEAEIDKKRPETLKLEAAHTRQAKKLEQSKAAIKAKKKEHKKHQEEVEQLKRQLADLQGQLDRLESQEDPQSQSQRLAAEHMEEYNQKKTEFGSKTSKLKVDKDSMVLKQRADSDARQQLEDNLAQLQEREEHLKAALAKAQEVAKRVSTDLKAFQEELKDLKAQETAAKDQHRRNSLKVERLEAELGKIDRDLHEARAERRDTEQEQRMAEAVGSMKRLFPGVHGRLSELCSTTQRKYQLAAVVVMGKLFDAVAVDDENVAKECIQYLREQRLPPMTFIPLATARVQPLQERLRTLGGSSKLVFDVLKFNEAIKTAVLYAVGNTLVCDGLSEARQLAWGGGSERHKVVTLDGTLLAKNGSMTGGTSGNLEERAARLVDQHVKVLKEQKEKKMEELRSIPSVHQAQQAEQDLRTKITGLERRVQYGQMELVAASEKAKQAKAELDAIQGQRKKLTPDLESLSKVMEGRQREISAAEERINAIADRIFRDFCRKVGVANIREYEEEPLKEAQRLAEHRLQLQSQVAKLNNQLEYEQHRDLQAPIKVLEEEVKAGQKELDNLAKKMSALQEERDALQAQLEDIQATVEGLKEKVNKAEEEVQESAKERSAVTARCGKAKRNVSVKEGQLVQLRAQRQELLEACEMEQIQLRTTGGDAVALELDTAGAPTAASLDQDLDYSSLPRRFVQAEGREAQEKLVEEVKAKMQDLSAQIASTAPNLKALEQYEAIKEKEKEVIGEFESIRTHAKEVTDEFLDVRRQRTQRFMRAFDHISGTIDRIYKDLTVSRTHPMGGAAYLSLESEEEPFLHGIKFTAMPPTKRFRDMEQLSGGEKTVAALALLFSIHSFRPSPFFVLDEVDAALDNLNVAKVAAYIHAKSRDEAMQGEGRGTGAESGGRQLRVRNSLDPEPAQVAGFQSVVISLKDQFYDKADALVGVYRDTDEGCSKVLTFNLSEYPA